MGDGAADAAALARALRDAGVEVVLVRVGAADGTDPLDPALLAEVVLQEDAAAVGVVGGRGAGTGSAVVGALVEALEAAGRGDAVAFSLDDRPVGEVAASVVRQLGGPADRS